MGKKNKLPSMRPLDIPDSVTILEIKRTLRAKFRQILAENRTMVNIVNSNIRQVEEEMVQLDGVRLMTSASHETMSTRLDVCLDSCVRLTKMANTLFDRQDLKSPNQSTSSSSQSSNDTSQQTEKRLKTLEEQFDRLIKNNIEDKPADVAQKKGKKNNSICQTSGGAGPNTDQNLETSTVKDSCGQYEDMVSPQLTSPQSNNRRDLISPHDSEFTTAISDSRNRDSDHQQFQSMIELIEMLKNKSKSSRPEHGEKKSNLHDLDMKAVMEELRSLIHDILIKHGSVSRLPRRKKHSEHRKNVTQISDDDPKSESECNSRSPVRSKICFEEYNSVSSSDQDQYSYDDTTYIKNHTSEGGYYAKQYKLKSKRRKDISFNEDKGHRKRRSEQMHRKTNSCSKDGGQPTNTSQSPCYNDGGQPTNRSQSPCYNDEGHTANKSQSPCYNEGGQPTNRSQSPCYNDGGQPTNRSQSPFYNDGGQPTNRSQSPCYNDGGQPTNRSQSPFYNDGGQSANRNQSPFYKDGRQQANRNQSPCYKDGGEPANKDTSPYYYADGQQVNRNKFLCYKVGGQPINVTTSSFSNDSRQTVNANMPPYYKDSRQLIDRIATPCYNMGGQRDRRHTPPCYYNSGQSVNINYPSSYNDSGQSYNRSTPLCYKDCGLSVDMNTPLCCTDTVKPVDRYTTPCYKDEQNSTKTNTKQCCNANITPIVKACSPVKTNRPREQTTSGEGSGDIVWFEPLTDSMGNYQTVKSVKRRPISRNTRTSLNVGSHSKNTSREQESFPESEFSSFKNEELMLIDKPNTEVRYVVVKPQSNQTSLIGDGDYCIGEPGTKQEIHVISNEVKNKSEDNQQNFSPNQKSSMQYQVFGNLQHVLQHESQAVLDCSFNKSDSYSKNKDDREQKNKQNVPCTHMHPKSIRNTQVSFLNREAQSRRQTNQTSKQDPCHRATPNINPSQQATPRHNPGNNHKLRHPVMLTGFQQVQPSNSEAPVVNLTNTPGSSLTTYGQTPSFCRQSFPQSATDTPDIEPDQSFSQKQQIEQLSFNPNPNPNPHKLFVCHEKHVEEHLPVGGPLGGGQVIKQPLRRGDLQKEQREDVFADMNYAIGKSKEGRPLPAAFPGVTSSSLVNSPLSKLVLCPDTEQLVLAPGSQTEETHKKPGQQTSTNSLDSKDSRKPDRHASAKSKSIFDIENQKVYPTVKAIQQPNHESSSVVCVSDIPLDTPPASFLSVVKQCGHVSKICFLKHKQSKSFQGKAYVTFSDPSEASRAVFLLNGVKVFDRTGLKAQLLHSDQLGHRLIVDEL